MNARSKIIEVATRHFAINGTEGTTLQAIADDVGIRKPSILYHFDNKESLRRQVLDDVLARWNEVVPRLIQATTESGKDRFDALASEVIDFFCQDPNRARLLHRAIIERPSEIKAALRTHVRPWIRILSDQIRGEVNSEKIDSNCDAPAFIVVFICAVVGTISMNASLEDAALDRGNSRDSLQRLLNELLRTTRAGLYPALVPPTP